MSYQLQSTNRALALLAHTREQVRSGLVNDPAFSRNYDIDQLKEASLSGDLAKFRDDFLRALAGESVSVDLHHVAKLDRFHREIVVRLMSECAT